MTTAEVKFEILLYEIANLMDFTVAQLTLIKCVSDLISESHASLINASVVRGCYPNKLKLAKIVPVFNSDDEYDTNDYRLISLLSNFNRIFEKLMYKFLFRKMKYCMNNSMTSENRFRYNTQS